MKPHTLFAFAVVGAALSAVSAITAQGLALTQGIALHREFKQEARLAVSKLGMDPKQLFSDFVSGKLKTRVLNRQDGFWFGETTTILKMVRVHHIKDADYRTGGEKCLVVEVKNSINKERTIVDCEQPRVPGVTSLSSTNKSAGGPL